jgi:hypothetical protein
MRIEMGLRGSDNHVGWKKKGVTHAHAPQVSLGETGIKIQNSDYTKKETGNYYSNYSLSQ